MNKDPLISVVINSYNYGNYIKQAIESAIIQDFPFGKWEIIVVDDGSTDDTTNRINEFRDRIIYLHKMNGGQASAINAGAAAARGEVICLLDADDYFYPNKLRKVYAEFEKHPDIGIIYNRFDMVNELGNIIEEAIPSNLKAGDLRGRTLLGFPSGSPSSGISVRKSVLTLIRIPEESFRISADYFYLNILPLVAKVGIVNTPLHAYRKHENNLYLKNSYTDRKVQFAHQKDVVWDYAEHELGQKFFSALNLLMDEGINLTLIERTQIWIMGLRYLLHVRAPLNLKLWSLAKMTALVIIPRKIFLRIRTLRNRGFEHNFRY